MISCRLSWLPHKLCTARAGARSREREKKKMKVAFDAKLRKIQFCENAHTQSGWCWVFVALLHIYELKTVCGVERCARVTRGFQ